jgi:Flp pilus assembly protein TadG
MKRRAQRRPSDRGMTALELTLVAPLLLWWIMLIVQYGLWWHAKQVANAAAAEAVDVTQTPTGTAEDGEMAARAYLAQAGNLTNTMIAVDRGATDVSVQVQGDAPQLVPGWSWGVTAESQAPVEEFTPPGDP